MRLISLEFEGVGSFADHMQIDFETLGSAGLFLIEGPTGAGKSTILDAIVFALYGSPAGSESDPGRLDSHVRDSNREPYVELVFAIGAATYRIRRTPRHEREKRRGTGMKVDDGGVSLVRVAPDPAGISAKAKEVGDWIIEHIGLSKQQFVSTIVLAQGEFSSFLNAETRDRTPILEKVFGTEFYQDVEQQLAQMRREAIAARGQASDHLTESIDRCLGLLGIDPSDDPIAAIDAELTRLRDQQVQAEGHAAVCATAATAAADQLAAAEDFAAAQEKKRILVARRQELEGHSAQIEAMRFALIEHDRAKPVMAAVQAWREAESAARDAGTRCEQRRAALEALGESEVSDERLHEVTGLRAQLSHPAALEARMPHLRAEVDRLEREVGSAESDVADLTCSRDRLVAQIDEDGQATQRPDGDADRLAALHLERAGLVRQIEAQQRIAADSQALAEAHHRLGEAELALRAVLSDLAAARRSQLVNLAGTLASQLVDGEACLVCGSVQHPSPAQPKAGSDHDVEALEAQADRAREAVQEARAACEQLDGQLSVLRAASPDDPTAAIARLADVEREETEVRAAVEAAEQARVRHTQAQSALVTVNERLTQALLQAQQRSAELKSAQEQLRDAGDAVAAALAGHPSVAARLEALAVTHQALSASLEADRASSQASRTASHAQKTLAATLAAVGIADARTAEDALLDDSVATQYRARVEQHDAEWVAVDTGLQEMSDVDLEVATDVAALRRDVEQRRERLADAQRELGRLRHTREQAAPLRDQVRERLVEHDRVRADTAGVIRMADLATATRGEGIHRVRLSAFVLMRRFESVVEAANDRLDAISEGRYQLKVEHKGLDNRGQHGLDLLVEDMRTQRCRSTRSLSGGESFYVSLALALGLADVVRSESGGVSLGTLFIDEGFGSLDAEVLEEVIDMLEQVRAGEDRVIGLVSHVDLLNQRIDPRISVRRDPQRAGVSTLEVRV